ncbi:unnamed protein product [Mycena citricolor]|uniref:Transcriptional repressor Tup1 N-terminal domain-containing protein n=1 Tax=Mycena citricolor TaxID=2018698 RepID=A0AAD2Q104_9AGAR|nr:unnamed protein product [Mycena citricolor]
MSSNPMYQHRALGPADAPVYNSRALSDTLDRVKQEFDVLAGEVNVSREQRERYEATITAQADELEKIRQALHELEAQHNKVRQQYEYELRMLRSETHNARQARPSSAVTAPINSPSVFLGGSAAQSPVMDPHSERRDRERDRERDSQRARFLDQGNSKRMKLDQPEASRLPLIGPGSSPSSRRAPTPASLPLPPPLPPQPSAQVMNEFLDNLEPISVHPEFKKEGSDWFTIYNPKVKRVLDVNLIHTFVHETVVCCIHFSHDGKFLATGCNRTAQIFSVLTGHRICTLADETASETGDLYIRSVRFSPDGRFLATGAEDERIRIWEVDKRTVRAVFEGHRQDIYSLHFSPDGRRLASGSGDGTVRIWSMDTYDIERVLTASPELDAIEDEGGVMAVAFSPDGQMIAAGCVDSLVRIWSVTSGNLVDILRGHSSSVHSVVFTKDGGGLVSGALDNSIRCWDLRAKSKKEGIPCTIFNGHKDYVLSVHLSRDSQWIVSGSKDRGVHFWNTHGVVEAVLQGHKNSVISTSLHPTANMFATGSGDKLARIWSYTQPA